MVSLQRNVFEKTDDLCVKLIINTAYMYQMIILNPRKMWNSYLSIKGKFISIELNNDSMGC